MLKKTEYINNNVKCGLAGNLCELSTDFFSEIIENLGEERTLSLLRDIAIISKDNEKIRTLAIMIKAWKRN